jgi:hypothetical protein
VRRSLIAFVLLLGLAMAAWAQMALRLEFAGAGPRRAWVAEKLAGGALPEGTKTESDKLALEPGSFGPSHRVFVLDEATGNLASKPVSALSGGVWKVAPSDFDRIGEVRVRVEHKGNPVESASVTLESKAGARTQVLDAASQGETSFFAVPPGEVKVVVRYKTVGGETPEPVRQSTEISLKRERPVPHVVVSLVDEVATVAPSGEGGASGSGTAQTSEDAKTAGGLGWLGTLLSFLLALGLAVLLVWFGMQWLKKNQDQVQAKLGQLGVEIPGQAEEAQQAGYQPQAPVAPPPPEKILLDDSDPASVAPSAPAPAGALDRPRLVSADGDELPLEEGSLEVGREAGLGLSLLDESTVSRRHAEIVRSGPSIKVRDLGSTNGTFVNGVQVQVEAELRPGDTVQFGAVRFRLEG